MRSNTGIRVPVLVNTTFTSPGAFNDLPFAVFNAIVDVVSSGTGKPCISQYLTCCCHALTDIQVTDDPVSTTNTSSLPTIVNDRAGELVSLSWLSIVVDSS